MGETSTSIWNGNRDTAERVNPMPDLSAGTYRPIWKNRRRVIFLSLLFCASMVTYLVIAGEDTSLNETVVTGSFLLAAGVIGSYVFGSTWDDANLMQSLKK